MANPTSAFGAFTQGFNNDIWNPVDFVLPGTTFLNKMFDPTGQQAAAQANTAQWMLQKDAQAFNAAEAEKARQFEAEQTSTAYQRAVADMKKAGLNPYWINALNGGASSASGYAASSSQGSSSMANNKLAVAAGLIATALRMFMTKGK